MNPPFFSVLAAIFAVALANAETATDQTAAPSGKPAAADQKQPIEPVKFTLLATDGNSVYLVPVLVGGEYVGFIVDSGAAKPLIFAKSLAEKQHREIKADGVANGVGGDVAAGLAEFGDIVIDRKIKVQTKASRVMDLSKVSIKIKGKDETVSGVIGAPFLADARMIFDYETPCMRMLPKESPAQAFKTQSLAAGDHVFPLIKGETNFAFATVRIREKDYAFLVDTGSSINVIDPQLAESLQLTTRETTSNSVGAGGDRTKNLKRVTIDQPLIAGKLHLHSIEFFLVPTKHLVNPPKGLEFGGIIGTETLAFLKAKIDFDSYSLIVPKSLGSKRE